MRFKVVDPIDQYLMGVLLFPRDRDPFSKTLIQGIKDCLPGISRVNWARITHSINDRMST